MFNLKRLLPAAILALLSPALFAQTHPAAHWQQCGWGGGGFYWSAAIHPSKDGVMYVGGDVCGVYKTTDAGKHWRIANDGLADYSVYSLAVDPSHPDVVYAGTEGGICKSADAGEHWTFLKQTAPKTGLNITAVRNKSVRPIAVDPAGDDVVYAGTPDGRILRGTYGAQSWREVYQLKDKGSISSVFITADGKSILAATTTAGIIRSSDGGATWTELPTPKNASSVISRGEVIYGSFWKEGVQKSTDGGKTFAATNEGLMKDLSVREIAIDPKDPQVVHCVGAVGWNGAYHRSTDGGKTWTAARSMKHDPAGNPTLPEEYTEKSGQRSLSTATNIAINPRDPNQLLIPANWRIAISEDAGKTLEERDRGADITCVSDIRFLDGKVYVTSMDEGLMRSDDDGASWQQLFPRKYEPVLSGHQWRVVVWKDTAEHIVTTCSPWGKQINTVLRSDDGGKTFAASAQGLPDQRPHPNTMWGEGFARALAADPKDPKVLYLGIDGDPDPKASKEGGGIFKSTDGGHTWKRPATQPGSRRVFFGLAVDPTDPNRIFWGTCGNGGGLYRSEDGGDSWTHVMSNESWVFNVHVAPSGAVYCPGANLWRSADHGKTWKQLTKFTDSISIVGLDVDPADEKTIWISRVSWSTGAAGGVYRSTDGGATWQEITGDLPYRKPLVLRYNPATKQLWAGGVGLYKLQ